MLQSERAPLRIVTIGAYGFDEESFFRAIEQADIDTFCDVRQRRGMRGPLYAFANSNRLQDRLQQLGITYIHLKELAPSDSIRAIQRGEDKRLRTGKRNRSDLSSAFVHAYETECLQDFTPDDFLHRIGPNAQTVAFFCVERLPEACHRSLVAAHFGRILNASVEHLSPCMQ